MSGDLFTPIFRLFNSDVRIVLWAVLLSVLGAPILRWLLYRLLFRLAMRQGSIGRRVILVGNSREGAVAFVREAMLGRGRGVELLGFVGEPCDGIGCPRLGGFDSLRDVLDSHKPNYAVFAFDSYEKERIIELVGICDDRCVKVYFLPILYGYLKSSRQVEILGQTPLINVHSTPLDAPINAFLKRAVDIFGSLLLIILLSPIMLLAAIGVRLSSSGSILFKQRRVGRMGRQFYILKFRSMREPCGVEEFRWSTGADPRKTRFGHFIRRTSIDELPQLFNVLHGTMSLVGPRPEIPRFVEHFKDRIPLYMVKHYVKPGMTGLAQIRGLRGDTSVEERISADIHYIENWSLLGDFKILLKTPLRLINKKEIYGADNRGGE